MWVLIFLVLNIGVNFEADILNPLINFKSIEIGFKSKDLMLDYFNGYKTEESYSYRNSQTKKKPQPIHYITQGYAGFIMGVGLLLIGGMGFFSERGTETEALISLPLMLTAIPVGSAVGVTISGKKMDLEGSFWKSLIGASIPYAAGIAIIILSSIKAASQEEVEMPLLSILGGCVILVGPPIGAVIGYHWK